MQFYFFRTIDASDRYDFRQVAVKQNIVTTKVFSSIIAITSILSTISLYFINFGSFLNLAEYKVIHYFILISSITCLITVQLTRKVQPGRQLAVDNVIGLSYAVCVALGFLGLTFIAQHNPSNTITMFLIGMLSIGVLWILDTVQTTLLSIIIVTAFYIGLRYFQTDPERLLPNEIVGTCVIIIFFCISRMCYSYRYNHFVQLKTITAKSEEIAGINKTQTEILGMVAHDLRSPMNNIIGLVDLVKDPSLSEAERKEMYDMMLVACKETDNIIHDLIDVARKTHTDQLLLSKIALNDFILSVQQQWAHRLGNRKLVFDKSNDEIIVSIHLQKVQRVLDNLINNAIKFTKDDGTIKINTSLNGKATIAISDDGVGIPAALLPYIFERFSRAGRPGINGEKSYGLGLSICKQIIEAHEGDISANSIEGKGTTFTITLPLKNNTVPNYNTYKMKA